jgi:osmotically-inducible protein OsmY
MSTLQHTSELRERTTRRLVLIVAIATIVLGGIVAAIVANTTSGGSAKFDSSRVVHAQPMYASGALERELAPLKAAQGAQPEVHPEVQTAQPKVVQTAQPEVQTPGQRP